MACDKKDYVIIGLVLVVGLFIVYSTLSTQLHQFSVISFHDHDKYYHPHHQDYLIGLSDVLYVERILIHDKVAHDYILAGVKADLKFRASLGLSEKVYINDLITYIYAPESGTQLVKELKNKFGEERLSDILIELYKLHDDESISNFYGERWE